jgi:hypothetical protein
MAAKKAKPGPVGRKASQPVVVQRRVVQVAAVAGGSGSSNRLLREAAWSRMFGRVEAKNPFSR